MKYFIFLILFHSFSLVAGESHPNKDAINHINSDKLSIIGLDEIYYDNLILEPANPITIKFDLDNVESVIVTDENAKNAKCEKFRKQELFFLTFSDPSKNNKQISTRINGPCLVGKDLKLLLRVKTADGMYYKKTVKVKVKPIYINTEYE